MSESPPRPPAVLAPLALAAAGVAVVAAVLALVRPWGDVGVTARGGLAVGRPGFALGVVGIGAVLAVVVAAGTWRGVARLRTPREVVAAGVVVTAVGVLGVIVVLGVASAQVFPRDGGWWALLAVIAIPVSGLAVAAGPSVTVSGPRERVGFRLVTVLVPVALVVVGAVVAPGWSQHRLDATHPASFAESPGPATVTRVAWRHDLAPGSVSAVLGGRAVVARDVDDGDGCRLEVRALDAGTGEAVWSVTRPLRCDGPRLTALDGDNVVVRLTLRGGRDGRPAADGPRSTVYLELESGRPLTPATALDDVSVWTEGFGLVSTDVDVRGLDPRTGDERWSRPLPRCTDGSLARLGLPTAPTEAPSARSPYDGASPAGAVPVVGTGNVVVVGTTCTGGGSREAWIVDVVRGAAADHVVALPEPGALGAAPGDVDDRPTTFLPWLDTVVAVVPVADPDGLGAVRAGLVAVDVASGTVLWQRAVAPLSALDLSPTTGDVRVSQSGTDPVIVDDARTSVLAIRTGAVLSTREDPLPVTASVALTGSRLEVSEPAVVAVSDLTSGEPSARVDLGGCRIPVPSAITPLLAGPGGVIARCYDPGSGGVALLGLTP